LGFDVNRRVVITGMGAMCGLGHNLTDVWDGVIQGRSGVSNIEQFNTENLAVKFAGEVKGFKLSEDLLSAKEADRYDRFLHFGLHSSKEALMDAGLFENNNYDPYRCGTLIGVGMGGFPYIEKQHKTLLDKGPRRVSPFFIPSIIPNMAPGLVSLKFNLKGINYNIASACASGGHAISAACFEIMSGRHDMMVTGGCEAVICELPMSGFINMKALSKRNDDPTKASRPFDVDRDGFVMGEGAGIMVLESLESAEKRGAKIYGEIVGHGATSDSHHITAPHPEGDGAYSCMNNALISAGISPEQIDYVNVHGTSTPLGDKAEVLALKRAFKDHSKDLLISSTKSMTGHLLGAAGGLESIFCAMAIHTGQLPPTINVDNQDEACDINCIPNKSINKKIDYALNNCFGFGGTNSSLIIKKHT
jgi:3-oxoacyl-[acyl-carrier-protein] synthase II